MDRLLEFALAAPEDVRCEQRGAGAPYRVKLSAGTLEGDTEELLELLPDERACRDDIM
jgi:hypothetical protein